MNGLNHSADEVVECPLCMEPLEVDDLNFFPCTCGYQICRFCWHRIRTDENELCPACRKEYPENPADFTPLTQEEMIAFKSQKRQRDQQRKQKITENRKHLANVRVVQKNLVFVVGLPPRLADADILKKHEYFGKFGKIHKVVINPSTAYAGVQGPSASAYVTYVSNSDALRAIQSVNNIMIDGRPIKTSLGTTKYCSHFMKNQQCPKGDCMYLHELGDPEASFTKEEMHQGKHQEYEKRLHDTLIASGSSSAANGLPQTGLSCGGSSVGNGGLPTNGIKNGESGGKAGGSAASTSLATAIASTTSSATAAVTVNGGTATATLGASTQQQKEAWPSLSVSPVNHKEVGPASKNKKDKTKHDKSKSDKNTKIKNNTNSKNNNNNSSDSLAVNKEQQLHRNSAKESLATDVPALELSNHSNNNSSSKTKADKGKDNHKTQHEKPTSNRNNKEVHQQQQHHQKEKRAISADEEVKLIGDTEKRKSKSVNSQSNSNNLANSNSSQSDSSASKSEDARSISASSSVSSNSSSSNSSGSGSSNSESVSTLSESVSGKSSPGSLSESDPHNKNEKVQHTVVCDSNVSEGNNFVTAQQIAADNSRGSNDLNVSFGGDNVSAAGSKDSISARDGTMSNSVLLPTKIADELLSNTITNDVLNTAAAFSKLNVFDDNNSFFSSTSAPCYQQSLLLKSKLGGPNPINSVITSHLPDLLNGIDGYQNSITTTNEWEEALKMMRNSKIMEDQAQLHQQQQQFRQQQLQQEKLMRLQEFQNRKGLLGLSQLNGAHNVADFPNILNNFADANRLQASAMQQQQQLLQSTQPTDHVLANPLFAANMSKFFDFHKNQQQQQIHQQFLMSGHGATGNSQLTDHLRMAAFLENNRINSHLLDQSNGLLLPQQQQIQKQRLLGKLDPMLPQQQPQNPQQRQEVQQPNQQTQANRISNQFLQNASADDDLGFDPFIETQKALAELIENENIHQNTNTNNSESNTTSIATKILQQQQQQQQQQFTQQQQLLDNMHRARMPPPGFNHMNAFGFGVPRSQNTSKILPFMNMNSNGAINTSGQSGQHMPNSWNPQLVALQQQQQQPLSDSQLNQMSQNHNKAYNNDWTAMDPAILSFRQFSAFPQQQQQQQQQQPISHPHQQDLFMQHLTQQQQVGQGFSSQTQLHGGVNLANGLLNPQQASQAQVNFSHSNWLSTEQTLFMNSLAGFTSNNDRDKFAIPLPPGIHQSNLNKQQKTECIN